MLVANMYVRYVAVVLRIMFVFNIRLVFYSQGNIRINKPINNKIINTHIIAKRSDIACLSTMKAIMT